MTTYPPVPDPPEPERSGDEPAGGWGPASESAPGTPEGTPPHPPASSQPPSTPPPPVGGGFDPYSGGAVPPPPPPPPPYNSDGPVPGGRQPRNGLGTAALVCGIIAVVLSFVPGVNWFTWPLGVLAIVFGAIGWSRVNKGQATNKGYTIAGLVLGILSFFTFCLAYWILFGASGTAINYSTAPLF